MRKPELGQIVGGKYHLLRELGRGGMATVFEAENTLTLKRAAVKWLHPQFHDEQQGLQRVIREARASSRIRHENVVDVYDVAEEGSSVYLVMELLQGELLSQVLEREELPMHELIALLVPAMRGVAAAHQAGVIHRDIKPENIFLARKSSHDRVVPKVIDFGISKMVEAEPALATRSGITMGTPRYASYEQLLGARDVDARTDVYAFGVILYEALTGSAPFGEAVTFAEQAVRLATQMPISVRELRPDAPLALEALVIRAIAKQREDRIATMDELMLCAVPFADPGRYAAPLLVRSLAAARRRSTVADAAIVRVSSPTEVPDSLPRDSDPDSRPSIVMRSQRRGLALIAIGGVAMAFALLAMRFEPSLQSRASRRRDEPRAGGIVSQPALAAPVESPTASEPALALPPAPSAPPLRRKRPRRALVVRSPTTASEPTPAPQGVEEPTHRAGRLRKAEF